MSLEKKFRNELAEIAIENNLSEKCELVAQQCVQICDEFAVGFSNFVVKEKYTKTYIELFEKKFYVDKTTTELLEIYKQGL